MVATLELVRIGMASGEGVPAMNLVDRLAAEAARVLGASCHVETTELAADFAFDMLRRQVWSTPLLGKLQERRRRGSSVALGITDLDLYVPILTFVFGEAQLRGPAAVISTHRLRDEYYGLPGDEASLVARMLKETLHELGHTQGLRHCSDWRCVMSSAHTVERVDLRQAGFCRECARALTAGS